MASPVKYYGLLQSPTHPFNDASGTVSPQENTPQNDIETARQKTLFNGAESQHALSGYDAPSPDETINNEDLFKYIQRALIKELSAEERDMLALTCGFTTGKPVSLTEAAQVMNMEEQEAKMVYHSGLNKLRLYLINLGPIVKTDNKPQAKTAPRPTNIVHTLTPATTRQ